MLVVMCHAREARWVRPMGGPVAAVCSEWQEFAALAPTALSVLVVPDDESSPTAGPRLVQLRRENPLLDLRIAAEPVVAARLARAGVTDCQYVDYDMLRVRLPGIMRDMLVTSPRGRLTAALVDGCPDDRVSMMIRRIFLAETPLRQDSQVAREARLSVSRARALIREYAGGALHDLIRWSRLVRCAELFASKKKQAALAEAMGVDVSLIVNDARALLGMTLNSAMAKGPCWIGNRLLERRAGWPASSALAVIFAIDDGASF